MSEDPAMDGPNWFIYCDNEPVGAQDPSGKWTWDDTMRMLMHMWLVAWHFFGGPPGPGPGNAPDMLPRSTTQIVRAWAEERAKEESEENGWGPLGPGEDDISQMILAQLMMAVVFVVVLRAILLKGVVIVQSTRF